MDYLGLLITDVKHSRNKKDSEISFVIPIAFILSSNCCKAGNEWASGKPETLKSFMRKAKERWTGEFKRNNGGVWRVNFDFKIIERQNGGRGDGLAPMPHADANGYNIVLIDCACDGQPSVVSGNFKNHMRICIDGNNDVERTFLHELGHIMGHEDAYVAPNGYVAGFKGNLMEHGHDVNYRNFDHMFEGYKSAGFESFFPLKDGKFPTFHLSDAEVEVLIKQGEASREAANRRKPGSWDAFVQGRGGPYKEYINVSEGGK